MTARPTLGRRAYAFAALGVIAFTLYGSYVPFQFRHRPWDEVTSSFLWAMQNRIDFESRSDGIANWMLGVPLGFCLLGALRADRPNEYTTALIGGFLIPLCTAFAALVEFGQLYFPARTCSGSDVIAQGFGSLCGVILWVTLGPWFTGQVRKVFDGADEEAVAVRFFAAYAGFVVLVQWLPLDFTVSPAEIYRRFFRDPGRVTYWPFEELKGASYRDGVQIWDKVQTWLELAILFFPLGLLASRVGRWVTPRRVVPLAVAFAFLTEAGQVTVARHTSSTDVIIGATALIAAWLLVKALRSSRAQGHRNETALILGQIWLFAMILIHWHPFRFIPKQFAARLNDLEWWPLVAQVGQAAEKVKFPNQADPVAGENYLWALDKILTKFILFVPLGILVAWAGKWANTRRLCGRAALISLTVAMILEMGQMILPGRLGSPTDVLFGVVGGWLGAAIAFQAIRASEEKNVLENTGWKPAPSPDGVRDA